MGQRQVQEGEGWRIGWDGNAPTYQGMLAGADWAIELTAAEFKDFCRLADQLADQMRVMADLLMDEEQITCDAESDLLWVEVSGFSEVFALRFIMKSGRRCEGTWSVPATGAILRAIGNFP